MEEEFEDTLEDAMINADFTDLIETINKVFPEPYTEFDSDEMLDCIFVKRKPYIWIYSDEDDRQRFLSVSMPFNDDVYEISDNIEYKDDYRSWSEVYHKRISLFWDYQLERVYEPYTLVKDWLETKFSHLLKESA